jgi:hypothetical protein
MIHRSGDEPAKITVERGSDKWTVDEKSIDKLPEELQAWARRMLTAANGDVPIPEIERLEERLPRPLSGRRRVVPAPLQSRDNEISELKEEMQKLREMVEKLQKEE